MEAKNTEKIEQRLTDPWYDIVAGGRVNPP